jgi:chromosome condensin MukBEF MukE localization factor
MSGEQLMGIMYSVYNNSAHLKMEEVKYREGVEHVEFGVDEDDERWRRICIDGEIITVEKGTVVDVVVCKGLGGTLHGEQGNIEVFVTV